MVGLFGWQKVKRYHEEVVLTCSEGDALAVFQETKLPTLSLPCGTTALPLEVRRTSLPPVLSGFLKALLECHSSAIVICCWR